MRRTHLQDGWERFLGAFGLYAFRCEECDTRFRMHILNVSSWIWAKCPRCYRMDLTVWNPELYRCRGWQALKLRLGAHHWRCEACRCNFASFRPRKRRYVRRTTAAPPDVQDIDSELASGNRTL